MSGLRIKSYSFSLICQSESNFPLSVKVKAIFPYLSKLMQFFPYLSMKVKANNLRSHIKVVMFDTKQNWFHRGRG